MVDFSLGVSRKRGQNWAQPFAAGLTLTVDFAFCLFVSLLFVCLLGGYLMYRLLEVANLQKGFGGLTGRSHANLRESFRDEPL